MECVDSAYKREKERCKMDKDIIEAEILSCVGFCVNDWNYGAKDILVLNTQNHKLLESLSRLPSVRIHYINKHGISLANMPNLTQYARAMDMKESEFDVVIDLENTATVMFHKLIKKDGILLTNLANLVENLEAAKAQIAWNDFRIKMPFCVEGRYYLFCSNTMHPLADMCLHKIDMLRDLRYYNAKIHEAIFALPNYLKVALNGIARN